MSQPRTGPALPPAGAHPGRPELPRAREAAVRAARAAGGLLRDRVASIGEIRHKGAVDLVTDVDLQSERLVRSVLLEAFPDHTIVGEEGGVVPGAESRCRWIVDPLDGTTNYAHGFPFYCVSIGLEVERELVLGVVYDPSLDELFVAQRGAGASLNGRRIRVSQVASLRQALLATGFPYDRRELPRAIRSFQTMSRRGQAVRRAGSAALDLCYVACGRLDGYWEHRVSPWDVAAGVVLVTEAGGQVTRVDGAAFALDGGDVLASTPAIHGAMAAALARG